MKTTVGGVDLDITAHCQFDSWETGIRAQVDHLALMQVHRLSEASLAQGAHIVAMTESPIHVISASIWFGWDGLGIKGKWAPSSQYGENVAEKVLMIRKQR